MSRTRFLVVIAVAAVLMQAFPQWVGALKWGLVLLGLVYLVMRALQTYPKLYRQRKIQAAEAAADALAYEVYAGELAALRAKYSVNDVGEDSQPPPSYEEELKALSEKHREMLTRKFGAY